MTTNNTEANRRCARLQGWIWVEDNRGDRLGDHSHWSRNGESRFSIAYHTDEYLGELLDWFTDNGYEWGLVKNGDIYKFEWWPTSGDAPFKQLDMCRGGTKTIAVRHATKWQ